MTKAPVAAEISMVSSPTGAIRLLLGGRNTRIEGFTNIDLFDGPNVDIRTDASDLSMYSDGSVSEIYCSHILEHFPHPKTVKVLSEWARVMKKGGKAYISVPDFDAVIRAYNKVGFCEWIRNYLYGDQIYDLAFHYTIFTFATLAASCAKAGFSDVKRIQRMPYELNDCSSNVDSIDHLPVSVNVEATR